MRPVRIGPACVRVQQALDTAMAEGVLALAPELRAHAHACPHCQREVAELAELLARLRTMAAGIPLVRVPALVAGSVTFALLTLNQVVSGTSPAQVVEQLAAPFRTWTSARVRDAK